MQLFQTRDQLSLESDTIYLSEDILRLKRSSLITSYSYSIEINEARHQTKSLQSDYNESVLASNVKIDGLVEELTCAQSLSEQQQYALNDLTALLKLSNGSVDEYKQSLLEATEKLETLTQTSLTHQTVAQKHLQDTELLQAHHATSLESLTSLTRLQKKEIDSMQVDIMQSTHTKKRLMDTNEQLMASKARVLVVEDELHDSVLANKRLKIEIEGLIEETTRTAASESSDTQKVKRVAERARKERLSMCGVEMDDEIVPLATANVKRVAKPKAVKKKVVEETADVSSRDGDAMKGVEATVDAKKVKQVKEVKVKATNQFSSTKLTKLKAVKRAVKTLDSDQSMDLDVAAVDVFKTNQARLAALEEHGSQPEQDMETPECDNEEALEIDEKPVKKSKAKFVAGQPRHAAQSLKSYSELNEEDASSVVSVAEVKKNAPKKRSKKGKKSVGSEESVEAVIEGKDEDEDRVVEKVVVKKKMVKRVGVDAEATSPVMSKTKAVAEVETAVELLVDTTAKPQSLLARMGIFKGVGAKSKRDLALAEGSVQTNLFASL